MESVNVRGGNDWRYSRDFEDIIYILNYCSDLVPSFSVENEDLKKYFKEEFSKIRSRVNIKEEIGCVLPYGEDGRIDYVIELIEAIMNLY